MMLRTLISLYKTLFFVWILLMLLICLAIGLGMMIQGQTQDVRSAGLSLLVAGPIFTIMLAGGVALMIENNELLRRIADNQSRSVDKPNDLGLTHRREPTLSARKVQD